MTQNKDAVVRNGNSEFKIGDIFKSDFGVGVVVLADKFFIIQVNTLGSAFVVFNIDHLPHDAQLIQDEEITQWEFGRRMGLKCVQASLGQLRTSTDIPCM